MEKVKRSETDAIAGDGEEARQGKERASAWGSRVESKGTREGERRNDRNRERCRGGGQRGPRGVARDQGGVRGVAGEKEGATEREKPRAMGTGMALSSLGGPLSSKRAINDAYTPWPHHHDRG